MKSEMDGTMSLKLLFREEMLLQTAVKTAMYFLQMELAALTRIGIPKLLPFQKHQEIPMRVIRKKKDFLV